MKTELMQDIDRIRYYLNQIGIDAADSINISNFLSIKSWLHNISYKLDDMESKLNGERDDH